VYSVAMRPPFYDGGLFCSLKQAATELQELEDEVAETFKNAFVYEKYVVGMAPNIGNVSDKPNWVEVDPLSRWAQRWYVVVGYRK
jgi:hypothetical protein